MWGLEGGDRIQVTGGHELERGPGGWRCPTAFLPCCTGGEMIRINALAFGGARAFALKGSGPSQWEQEIRPALLAQAKRQSKRPGVFQGLHAVGQEGGSIPVPWTGRGGAPGLGQASSPCSRA